MFKSRSRLNIADPPCSRQRVFRTMRGICLLSILSQVGACYDVSTYGIGTRCDSTKPCRSPLVCSDGQCELATGGGGSGAAGRTSSSASSSGGAAPNNSGVSGATATVHGAGGTSIGTDAGSYLFGNGAAGSGTGGIAASGASSGNGGTTSTETNDGGVVVAVSGAGGANVAVSGAGGANVAVSGAGGANDVVSGAGGANVAVSGAAGAGGVRGTEAGSGAAAGEPVNYAGTAGTFTVALRLPNGAGCQVDAQCDSTHCVDAVCCNANCDGQCETCSGDTTAGMCVRLKAGQPVGGRTPCTHAGLDCGGSCTGAKSCTYPDSSTICDPIARCLSSTTSQDSMACDGAGSCAHALTTTCVAPLVCNVNIDARCGLPVYTQVDVGQAHTCAVVSDGTLRCWGSSEFGRLGPEVTEDKFKPVVIPNQTNVVAVATGWGHTCVLSRDGKVTCWGANFNGNLGCTDLIYTMTPTRCTPFDAGTGVTQIEAGGEQTCARLANGRIKCWGRDDWGQAGNDSLSSQFTPNYVVGISDAIALAAGTWQTCVLLSTGQVSCFGNNERGILGAGDLGEVRIGHPVPMVGIDGVQAKAIDVDVSETSSCVVLDDHSMRCSGDNSYGQLGDGQTKSSAIPVLAQPSIRALAVAVADYVTCAFINSHSVRCWGRGSAFGGFGNGVYADSFIPVDVLLPAEVSFVAVTAQANHLCALSATGRIWCWGDNSFGQLGSDSYEWTSAVPVEVIAPVP